MNLDCLGNSFDLEMRVGTWFQCTVDVSLSLVMERLASESKMMEETDYLGISAHSLEGAMRAALRGDSMDGMEMLLFPSVGTF